MKAIKIGLFLMCFSVASAQTIKELKHLHALKTVENVRLERRSVDSLKIRLYFEEGSNVPFTGRVLTKDSVERKMYGTERIFINGKEYGITNTYFDNGKLEKKHVRNGDIYSNKSTGFYFNYYYDGSLQQESASYGEDGGWVKEYAPNGKLIREATSDSYATNVNGYCRHYDGINGNLTEEYRLEMHREVFRREYYKDGSLKLAYSDSTSCRKTYYPNGQLMMCDSVNKSGVPLRRIDYYEDGSVMQEVRSGYAYDEEKHRAYYFLDGCIRRYYENGVLESEINWLKDQIADTLVTTYYANGKIHTQIPYKEGNPTGVGYIYHPDGRTHAEMRYDSTGRIDTLNMFYYDSIAYDGYTYSTFYLLFPEEKAKYRYEEGRPFPQEADGHDEHACGPPDDERHEDFYEGRNNYSGVVKVYYENGKLKKEAIFTQGKKYCEIYTYHENGRLKTKAEYKNYLYDGLQSCYYPNGQVKYSVYYQAGQVADDTMRMYHDNGQLYMSASYKDGLKNGWETRYDRNGRKTGATRYEKHVKTITTVQPSNRKLNGVAKGSVYYADGRIRAEIVYLRSSSGAVTGFSRIGKINVYYYDDLDLQKESPLRFDSYPLNEYVSFINARSSQDSSFEIIAPDKEFYGHFNNAYRQYNELLNNESTRDSFYEKWKVCGEARAYHANGTLRKEVLYDFGQKVSEKTFDD